MDALVQGAAYSGKRAIDMAFSALACAMFAPVAVLIGVAIWLEDGGSPFFTQPRIGAARKSFRILKFRSMRDGRVTRVGQWLRRTGLDELLQFANVLRGEMSVVGPRPLTADDVARLNWSSARHDWRFAMKPGITGVAQLAGGSSARHSARLDRLYLRRQSALLDIRIIALSFAANVAGKATVRAWLRGAA
ncbi:MAG: sugar transferase [Pseudomonadota bacterium]|nr:sugar transferase [Pseudomonadota bacterium]